MTIHHSRPAVVASMTAVTVYLLAFLVPATVLVERDEHEGYLWAWAVVTRENLAAVLLVAMLGGVGVAAWLIAASRRSPRNSPPIAAMFAIAASFAYGGALALALAAPRSNEVYQAAIGVAVVAVVAIGAGPLTIGRRWVQLTTNIVAVVVLVLVVASAANYVDNSTDPLPIALSLAILGAPLVAVALERWHPAGAVVGRVILALHLLAITPLAIAAVSCEDDDCLPVAPWVVAVTLGAVWTLAARLAPRGPVDSQPSSERPQAVALVAAAPSAVVMIGLALAMGVGIDADPTPFTATPAAIESQLPGMLGWTSKRPCAGQQVAASTVVVVGADVGTDSRREVCFATFESWAAPAPMARLEMAGSPSLLDPLTGQEIPLPATYHSEALEPEGIKVVRSDAGRGRTRFEVVRNNTASTVLELSGGRDYRVWSYGLSDDGTWLFVLDNANRLIVVPIDGSHPPTVLDDRVSDRTRVEWGPGASFTIGNMRLRDPGDSTYRPDGIPALPLRDLINDQARLMEQVDVEFVVVSGEVYGRFLGLPAADATERGLCVWLSTRLGPGEMNGAHATVGAGDQQCFSESESQGVRCGSVLTLPTGIRADELTDRVMLLGANAALFIPITLEGYENRVTGLRRERRDWTLGPVTGSELPQLGMDDIRCGPQPNEEEAETAATEEEGAEETVDSSTRSEFIALLDDVASEDAREPGEIWLDCVADLWFEMTGTWDMAEIEGTYYGLTAGIFGVCGDLARSSAVDLDGFNDWPATDRVFAAALVDQGSSFAEVECAVARPVAIPFALQTEQPSPEDQLAYEAHVRTCIDTVPGPATTDMPPGEDDDYDQLWRGCALGRGLDCNELRELGSRYFEFGRSCGGRTVVTQIDCALLLHHPLDVEVSNASGGIDLDLVPSPSAAPPGWSTELDQLWTDCGGGDPESCDDLYSESPIDSIYEVFGDTCGGRAIDVRCSDLLATLEVGSSDSEGATSFGADYCQALDDMARAQPEGSMSDQEFAEAMAEYVDAVERFAAVSGADDADVLSELAQVMTLAAADPSSPELATMVAEIAGPVATITLPAMRECGLE